MLEGRHDWRDDKKGIKIPSADADAECECEVMVGCVNCGSGRYNIVLAPTLTRQNAATLNTFVSNVFSVNGIMHLPNIWCRSFDKYFDRLVVNISFGGLLRVLNFEINNCDEGTIFCKSPQYQCGAHK